MKDRRRTPYATAPRGPAPNTLVHPILCSCIIIIVVSAIAIFDEAALLICKSEFEFYAGHGCCNHDMTDDAGDGCHENARRRRTGEIQLIFVTVLIC